MVSPSGSLVQSHCREGGALQADIAVCGEHSQCSSHTGFAPAHWCVLSPSTLLRLPAAQYGVGPALRAVPAFGYSTKTRTRLGLRFVPSPAGASQATRSLTGTLSPGAVHLLPSAAAPQFLRAPVRCVWLVSILGELASSCDPPGGCQPSRISGSLWLQTGGLFAVW